MVDHDFNAQVKNLTKKIQAKRAKIVDKPLSSVVVDVPPITNLIFNCRGKLSGHYGEISCCVWSPIYKRVLSSSHDGKLIVWDAITKNKISATTNLCSLILTCAFSSSNEKLIACGGMDNEVTVYVSNDMYKYSQSCKLRRHTGYLSKSIFIGDRILSCSGDRTCILWDLETQAPIHTFRGHSKDVLDASVHPNLETFLTSSSDCTVKMWDTRTKQPVRSFEDHQTDVTRVKHFPNGSAFATISDDQTAKLFSIESDTMVGVYRMENMPTSMDFSKSGSLLFVGDENSSVHIFDVLRQEEISSINTEEGKIKCVSASPDGDAFLTASGFTIRLWN